MARFDLDAWMRSQQGKHYCRCGCGGVIEVKPHHHARGIPRFINRHSVRVSNPMSGRNEALNPNYRGGRYIDRQGYVVVLNPKRTTHTDRYVFEHRLIAEKTLGRKLQSSEHVHHKNGIRTDNHNENLEVLSDREHSALHDSELRKRLGEELYFEARRRICRGESYKEIILCRAS